VVQFCPLRNQFFENGNRGPLAQLAEQLTLNQ
jgi:hypothetical protein